ncbi:unnamed protein product, partial [Larinioides sclopetarius]
TINKNTYPIQSTSRPFFTNNAERNFETCLTEVDKITLRALNVGIHQKFEDVIDDKISIVQDYFPIGMMKTTI